MLSRSPSLEVGPPSVGRAPGNVAVDGDDRLLRPGLGDLKHQFDDILVQSYGYPGSGRRLLASCAPLYIKFVGVVPASGLASVVGPIRLRNIRVGKPAIAHRLHIGEVVRFEGRTLIHNLEGRKTNTWCSTMRVRNAHHEGRNCYAPGCNHSPPLPRHVCIVCIDT